MAASVQSARMAWFTAAIAVTYIFTAQVSDQDLLARIRRFYHRGACACIHTRLYMEYTHAATLAPTQHTRTTHVYKHTHPCNAAPPPPAAHVLCWRALWQELMERLHLELLMAPKLGPRLMAGFIHTLPARATVLSPWPVLQLEGAVGVATATGLSTGGASLQPGAGCAVPEGDAAHRAAQPSLGSRPGCVTHVHGAGASAAEGGSGQQLLRAVRLGLAPSASDVVLLACAHSAATALVAGTPGAGQTVVVEGQVGRGVPLVALRALAASCRCVRA